MDIKKSIQEWFKGPQDFDRGLELLHAVSKKSRVLGKLAKGESKSRREKLTYELSKAIGLKKIPAPNKNFKAKVLKTLPSTFKYIKELEDNKAEKTEGDITKEQFGYRLNLIGKDESIDDYPEELKMVINEYSSLYMERGKLHKEMVDLGDSNEIEVANKRKEYVDKIKSSSERMESLFESFSAYKNAGTVPEGSHDNEKAKKEGTDDIEELKKLKKNLQASLAKDRNLLKYRNKTKPSSGEENPMPAGPKRIKLEKRVKIKEDEIVAIDTKLANLE